MILLGEYWAQRKKAGTPKNEKRKPNSKSAKLAKTKIHGLPQLKLKIDEIMRWRTGSPYK